MPGSPDFEALRARLGPADPVAVEGTVTSLVGLTIRARVPGARVGDTVEVVGDGRAPLLAEVKGFSGSETVLVPLGELEGIGPGDRE